MWTWPGRVEPITDARDQRDELGAVTEALVSDSPECSAFDQQ
jgi:hypothetical protein